MPPPPPPKPPPSSDEELLAECRVETFRAGGKGGQHQNATDSAVRLVHLPSGIVVTARRRRSQHRNKADALGRLRMRLELLARPEVERRSTRVPAKQRRERLEAKRKRSTTKRLRQNPNAEED
jgi:protein subunit release factor A